MSGIDFVFIHPLPEEMSKLSGVKSILSVDSFPGPMCNYKCWYFTLSIPYMGRREVDIKICLRHSQSSGSWMLIVNGEIKIHGSSPAGDGSIIASFKIFEVHFYLIVKRSMMIYMDYVLRTDSNILKEINEDDEILSEALLPFDVTIYNASKFPKGGRDVVVYHITTHLPNNKEVAIDRRYSEFTLLDEIVRGITRNHQLKLLPNLPGKVLNPMTDQTESSFIEARRISLEYYLKILVKNKHFVQYMEVLEFLGLDPIFITSLNVSDPVQTPTTPTPSIPAKIPTTYPDKSITFHVTTPVAKTQTLKPSGVSKPTTTLDNLKLDDQVGVMV